jgi:hypothetical protein
MLPLQIAAVQFDLERLRFPLHFGPAFLSIDFLKLATFNPPSDIDSRAGFPLRVAPASRCRSFLFRTVEISPAI